MQQDATDEGSGGDSGDDAQGALVIARMRSISMESGSFFRRVFKGYREVI
jgi:hypothetical protein